MSAKAFKYFREKLADAGVAVVDPEAAIANAVAISGGEAPTEAEYNLLVTKINAILAALRAQGLVSA